MAIDNGTVEITMKILEDEGTGLISPRAVEPLRRFVSEHVRFSRNLHLVGRKRYERSLAEQILDSLLLLKLAEDERASGTAAEGAVRAADIGAGFGFPGLVWKIVRPEILVTLFERREKASLFLERMNRALGLEGIEVELGDAYGSEREEGFEVVASKAAGRLGEIAPLAARLLVDGGVYVTVKGKDWAGEMGKARIEGMRLSGRGELPGGRGVLLAFSRERRPPA